MSAYDTWVRELSQQDLLEETLKQHDKAAVLAERLAALIADIDAAVDYSGNRWSEWGSRAETVLEMIEAAVLKARG